MIKVLFLLITILVIFFSPIDKIVFDLEAKMLFFCYFCLSSQVFFW